MHIRHLIILGVSLLLLGCGGGSGGRANSTISEGHKPNDPTDITQKGALEGVPDDQVLRPGAMNAYSHVTRIEVTIKISAGYDMSMFSSPATVFDSMTQSFLIEDPKLAVKDTAGQSTLTTHVFSPLPEVSTTQNVYCLLHTQ